jgi:hypothetical protein
MRYGRSVFQRRPTCLEAINWPWEFELSHGNSVEGIALLNPSILRSMDTVDRGKLLLYFQLDGTDLRACAFAEV